MGSNWLKIQRKEVGFGTDGKPGGLFDDEAGPLGYNMNMYKEPPRETVAIEDFERYAIDRLRGDLSFFVSNWFSNFLSSDCAEAKTRICFAF